MPIAIIVYTLHNKKANIHLHWGILYSGAPGKKMKFHHRAHLQADLFSPPHNRQVAAVKMLHQKSRELQFINDNSGGRRAVYRRDMWD